MAMTSANNLFSNISPEFKEELFEPKSRVNDLAVGA